MLHRLVPEDVARRRKDEIYEVMGELAIIVEEEDGSSWSYSRKDCVEYTCIYFDNLALAEPKLKPTLTKLVHTWRPRCSF